MFCTEASLQVADLIVFQNFLESIALSSRVFRISFLFVCFYVRISFFSKDFCICFSVLKISSLDPQFRPYCKLCCIFSKFVVTKTPLYSALMIEPRVIFIVTNYNSSLHTVTRSVNSLIKLLKSGLSVNIN